MSTADAVALLRQRVHRRSLLLHRSRSSNVSPLSGRTTKCVRQPLQREASWTSRRRNAKPRNIDARSKRKRPNSKNGSQKSRSVFKVRKRGPNPAPGQVVRASRRRNSHRLQQRRLPPKQANPIEEQAEARNQLHQRRAKQRRPQKQSPTTVSTRRVVQEQPSPMPSAPTAARAIRAATQVRSPPSLSTKSSQLQHLRSSPASFHVT